MYTVEIDNTHGIFFAPFNLTILKMTVNLHYVRINDSTLMHISVCDLKDFN